MRREKYEEDRVKEKKNKFKLKNLFLIYFIKINFFCRFLKLIFNIFDFFIKYFRFNYNFTWRSLQSKTIYILIFFTHHIMKFKLILKHYYVVRP